MSRLDIFNGTKVLITGHNGFKGTWLSAWLTKLGAEVTGVSLKDTTDPSHFHLAGFDKSLDNNYLDIRDANSLKKIVKKTKPDFIFHLAAQAIVRKSYRDPIEAWQTNTLGTVNLLDSLRFLDSNCVVIMITSDKCYDNVEWEWGYRETDLLGGPDPYSGSKGAAELAIKSYVKSYFPKDGHINIGIGRAGNVIGGGDWAEDRIVPDSIRSSIQNKEVLIRNPIATRPWQHVLEPLSGYLNLALELHNSSSLHGEAFNFGPTDTQNRKVIELVSSMTTYWDRVKWRDASKEHDGPYESGLLKLNCDKALHYLDWRPTWDFDRTVKETTLWYKNYYSDKNLNVLEYTSNQISEFEESARKKEISWSK